jgi:hypothetical protein
MTIIKQDKYVIMISNIIFVLSFSLFTLLNIQNNAYAQGNDTASEEMLSAQINGTGTISPMETETRYEGFSEPQTPSLEQLRAFEEEITEEERVYPQEFQRESEGAQGLAEAQLNESTATDVLVSPPELNGNFTEGISNNNASSNTITQNTTLAPTFTLYKSTIVSPTQYRSTVAEPSVGNQGPIVFYTGNWFAARSADYGSSWNYVNPLQGMSDFCCDQDVIYDKNYKIFIWYRQGMKDANGENRFILSISKDAQTWTSYSIHPTAVNQNWKNSWWDYPHLSLSNNKLYITSNMFDKNDQFVRSVITQWDLNQLSSGSTVNFQYYFETNQFNYTPVQGATDTMYWAVHNTNAQMKLYKWSESTNTINIAYRNTPAFQWGSMSCPGPDGINWCARSDSRILTGWINNGEIGFAWNVKQGGSFTYPYVHVVVFKEAGLTYKSNPVLWSSNIAWMYPFFSPDFSGNIGFVAYYGGGSYYPSIAAGIINPATGTPPPYPAYSIVLGKNGADRWGDYDRTRPLSGVGPLFEGAAATLQGCTTGSCLEPRYFIFGLS